MTGFACLLVLFGTLYAFTRGAGDFAVFHSAWKLVLEGRGATLYHATPDRFLYAPGFAFLFAPLGWIPEKAALGIWCALKALALVLVLKRALKVEGKLPVWVGALAVIIVARPLMIDFQYGQVNTWILLACWAALLGRAERARGETERTAVIFLEWFALAVAGWAKLFPLPLLILPFLPPFFPKKGQRTQLRAERAGVMLATFAIFGLPFLLGTNAAFALHMDWWKALQDRGLPLESHNQSLSAILHHLFTGQPTHVISLYASRNLTWFHWLSLIHI